MRCSPAAAGSPGRGRYPRLVTSPQRTGFFGRVIKGVRHPSLAWVYLLRTLRNKRLSTDEARTSHVAFYRRVMADDVARNSPNPLYTGYLQAVNRGRPDYNNAGTPNGTTVTDSTATPAIIYTYSRIGLGAYVDLNYLCRLGPRSQIC